MLYIAGAHAEFFINRDHGQSLSLPDIDADQFGELFDPEKIGRLPLFGSVAHCANDFPSPRLLNLLL
jgi:hypothetical protein